MRRSSPIAIRGVRLTPVYKALTPPHQRLNHPAMWDGDFPVVEWSAAHHRYERGGDDRGTVSRLGRQQGRHSPRKLSATRAWQLTGARVVPRRFFRPLNND